MEKLGRQNKYHTNNGMWAWTVLLENVPMFVLEENIRELFLDYKVKVNSVKFWMLPYRNKLQAFC
jgi:hypothetical protein